MTKLRTGDAWMPAPAYGGALTGLTINLVVASIEDSLRFHTRVLGAATVYSDPDIAVLRFREAEWLLHAAHTYDDHPLIGRMGLNSAARPGGALAELRLHGRDPDEAEAIARELGYEVLAATKDKPHGLREAYIFDETGYLWVPDVPVK